MCFYAEIPPSDKLLEKRYKASLHTKRYYEDNQVDIIFNGFTNPKMPIIMCDMPDKICLVRWGLIPTHISSLEQAKSIQTKTLNACIETVHEKMSYKNSQNLRCLVIVKAIIEPHQKPDKSRERYRIWLKDEDSFALGGIFSYWKSPENGKYIRTFSILTTVANEMMAKIHNTRKRMPVIISPDKYEEYLSGEKNILDYKTPFDENLMIAEKLSA
ncbi:SOS response-associated peptidase family protein [Arcicella aquatica]|uniref:Abasic site processing protein n=1 Tax=Arcicella aquatica TaxID=217141 RepID=A0ABU5QJC3_9BACT|nr:SOS response-associated peptidase family protein [Arcicella aquatica]MEA5257162.1 SOS response-associated peptidase family protein [Arcicella aquatica]